MEEVWKDIKIKKNGIIYDYIGLYQISNKGRVKSLNYCRSGKEGIIKPRKCNSGYFMVKLAKNGTKEDFLIHRLVANAFIPNPNCLPLINHKDEDKENNNVDNLEWCDDAYNNTYGTYRESRVIHFSELKDIEKYDMVLTWSNSTRKEINQLIRKKLGLNSIYPVKGEKLMCLKNNYYHTIDLGDDLVLNPVNGLNLFSLNQL